MIGIQKVKIQPLPLRRLQLNSWGKTDTKKKNKIKPEMLLSVGLGEVS